MPGIAGIIGKGRPRDNREAIGTMVSSMQHERFYTNGTHIDQRMGVWLGWTCLPGSFADCMPVWNEKKDICLIFCGEVFSDGEEIARLKARGHEGQLEKASYLVHLYEETGLDCLKKLNGWFGGVLIDLRKEKIFLFNDRYGMGRIYFHEDDSGFYFASEAKALLKVLSRTRELDSRSFAEFLTCGCVLQNRTLFSGISLVPGGSLWTFSGGGSPQKQAYFSRDAWEKQPQLEASEYYETFKAIWKRILPRYFRPGERSALSLTGGVDSRMILAWLNPQPRALTCYTWGSQYRDCWDVRIARKVAGICGQSHQSIPLNGTFLSEFPNLAERAVYISDGNKSVTGAVDLYLQPLAREIAPVRLSGGYGGELLRRKVSFKSGRLWGDLFTPELLRFTEVATATYASELKDHKASFSAFKQAPWYAFATFSLEQSQLILRTPYLDNDLVALTYQAPAECLDIFFLLRVISEGNPSLAKIWTDRGFNLRPPPILKQLRRWFHEFTFKAEYAYNEGMPQWLAKLDGAFASLHLERLFLGRHKIDHFRIWYRNELADYIKETLLDPSTLSSPYLQGKGVENIVQNHVKGTGNYTDEITKILSIEFMRRQLLETNRSTHEAPEMASRNEQYVMNNPHVLNTR